MIDVKIDHAEGRFKYRVSGALKCEDKYLFVKMNQNDFFCLPGGHVELGESANQAVKREMEEELGFKVKVTKYLGEIENFFNSKKDGKIFHELGKYFEVEAENQDDVNLEDYVRMENDKGFIQRLEFKWMTLSEAKNELTRPNKLIELIENKGEYPKNFINDERIK